MPHVEPVAYSDGTGPLTNTISEAMITTGSLVASKLGTSQCG
jgi:hypothetical protein